MSSALKQANVRSAATSALGVVGEWDRSGIVTVVGQVMIFVIFALFDKLVVDTNFKCPCINPAPGEDEAAICGRSKKYAIWFLILTTILAAFLGTAALVGLDRRYAKPKAKKSADSRNNAGEKMPANGQEQGENQQPDGAADEALEARESQVPEDNAGEEMPADGQEQGENQKPDDNAGEEMPANGQEQGENQQPDDNADDEAAANGQEHAENQQQDDNADDEAVANGQEHAEYQQPDGSQSPPASTLPAKPQALLTFRSCSPTEVIRGIAQFLVVALAWLSILCIDGDYVACASTCHPYGNATCSEIRETPHDELPFSKEFMQKSRRVSQPLGICLAIFVAVVLLLTLAIKCNSECKRGKDLKWCSCEEQDPEDPEVKIGEAKQLLSDALPNAYIVQNI